MRLLILTTALWAAGSLLCAGDSGQWSSVLALHPGDRIGVIQTGQQRVEGRFVGATDSGITVSVDHDLVIAKDAVERIYKRPRVSRPIRIALGAGIGLIGGAIINATAGQRFENEGSSIAGAALGGGAALGAGIGALSGGGHKTIYQRR